MTKLLIPVLALSISAASPMHVVRMRTRAQSTVVPDGAGTSPVCYSNSGRQISCKNLDIQYYGGHVISNPKVYAVLWTSAVDSNTQSGIAGFYQALTNSPMLDWLSEYDTSIAIQTGGSAGLPGTNQSIGRGTFAGVYTITPIVSTKNLIGDADIYAELDAQIAAGNLPAPDADTIYMTYFPPGLSINDGTGDVSCVDYCAYHSTWQHGPNNQSAYYGVIPDYSTADGQGGDCTSGCGSGSAFQNLTSASTHELFEATTDAEVGLAQNNDIPLGWYDSETTSQGEIGDMCNQNDDTLPGTSYTVQQVFSQVTKKCQTSYFLATDFNISLPANTATLSVGGAAVTLNVQSQTTSGSAQTLALSIDSSLLPAGVTATLGSSSISSGSATTLTLTASGAAPATTDAVAVVVATAGSVVHTAAALVQVTGGSVAANDWSLSLSPAGQSVAAGASTTFSVSTRVAAGSAESIALAISGLPAGVTGSFSTASVNAGQSATLTLTADSAAAAVSATTFTVSGTSTSVPGGHSATSTIAVTRILPPTVSLSSPANNATVGGPVSLSATAQAGSGSSLTSLALFIDGAQVQSTASAALQTSWDSTAAANGPHLIAAVATDADGQQATATSNVTVTNDFSLQLASSTLTVQAGQSTSVRVSTGAVGGTESIALSVSGLPAGVTASFSAASVLAGQSSTLTLTADANAAAVSSASFSLLGTTASVPAGHGAVATLTVTTSSTSDGGSGLSDGGTAADGGSGSNDGGTAADGGSGNSDGGSGGTGGTDAGNGGTGGTGGTSDAGNGSGGTTIASSGGCTTAPGFELYSLFGLLAFARLRRRSTRLA